MVVGCSAQVHQLAVEPFVCCPIAPSAGRRGMDGREATASWNGSKLHNTDVEPFGSRTRLLMPGQGECQRKRCKQHTTSPRPRSAHIGRLFTKIDLDLDARQLQNAPPRASES